MAGHHRGGCRFARSRPADALTCPSHHGPARRPRTCRCLCTGTWRSVFFVRWPPAFGSRCWRVIAPNQYKTRFLAPDLSKSYILHSGALTPLYSLSDRDYWADRVESSPFERSSEPERVDGSIEKPSRTYHHSLQDLNSRSWRPKEYCMSRPSCVMSWQ